MTRAAGSAHVMRRMHEADMWPALSEWFKNRGFRAYAEVPVQWGIIDCVGYDGQHVEAVELKTRLGLRVIKQAALDQLGADRCWVLTPGGTAKCIVQAMKLAVGTLLWENGRVSVVREAGRVPRVQVQEFRARIIRGLGDHLPDIGGLPTIPGDGPATRCADAVRQYIRQCHPTGWAEVHDAVPNHYVDAASMARVMTERFNIRLSG